jgi:hypothetical protein
MALALATTIYRLTLLLLSLEPLLLSLVLSIVLSLVLSLLLPLLLFPVPLLRRHLLLDRHGVLGVK